MASICELLPRSSSSSSSSAREAEHIKLFVGKIFKVTPLEEGKKKQPTQPQRRELAVGVVRPRDFALLGDRRSEFYVLKSAVVFTFSLFLFCILLLRCLNCSKEI